MATSTGQLAHAKSLLQRLRIGDEVHLLNSLKTRSGPWVIEPKNVRRELLTARTLFTEELMSRRLYILNFVSLDEVLEAGSVIGDAEFQARDDGRSVANSTMSEGAGQCADEQT